MLHTKARGPNICAWWLSWSCYRSHLNQLEQTIMSHRIQFSVVRTNGHVPRNPVFEAKKTHSTDPTQYAAKSGPTSVRHLNDVSLEGRRWFNIDFQSVNVTNVLTRLICGSRGGEAGPDLPPPPEKSQKYTVSKQYLSGSTENYKASIQCWTIIYRHASETPF